MRPQVGMSGGKPNPRNDSVDSAMIAAATSMVPATITGPRALGRMWRTTWRAVDAPSARAASTNSLSRSDKNWARTSRATGRPGHDRDQHRGEPHPERNAPAIKQAGQQILAQVIGAEWMLP